MWLGGAIRAISPAKAPQDLSTVTDYLCAGNAGIATSLRGLYDVSLALLLTSTRVRDVDEVPGFAREAIGVSESFFGESHRSSYKCKVSYCAIGFGVVQGVCTNVRVFVEFFDDTVDHWKGCSHAKQFLVSVATRLDVGT